MNDRPRSPLAVAAPGRWLPLAGALLLAGGCIASSLRESPPDPVGSFTGETADRRPVELTIVESARGLIGIGTLDGDPFSVALLPGFRGVGLLTGDGRFLPLAAELSFDGELLVLDAFDEPLVLTRGAPRGAFGSGGFTGRFRGGGARDFVGELRLAQSGNLVLGSGELFGRSLVLSGVLDGPRRFRARAVFIDETEASLEAELDDRGKLLTISGLGGLLELRRR